MRRPPNITGKFIAAAFAALLAGCEKEVVRTEPPPPKVTVATPETRQLVDADNFNGWIEPLSTVDVRSRVRGHIVKVHFTDGDIVKADQLLFELDPRPLQQDVDRATEQVNIFKAQLKVAQLEEQRMAGLRKTNSASQLEVDMSFAKARSLEAQVEAQQHEVERKKLELEYSRVTAPIAGRIGRAMMTAGNLVNAGGSDPLLATIVAIDPVEVYFSIDERTLQRYQKVVPATQTSGTVRERKLPFMFGLESEEGYPHDGTINFADNRVDAKTGTILVRGFIPNPDGKLLPGSRVRVRLPMGDAKPSIVIPDTAILSDQDRRYVLLVGDKNVIQRRDIKPGKLLDDGMRVVTSGLTANDRLVTMGLQSARINYPVEPVAPATQPAVAVSQR
jgi:RND family efflux transporter MFP subunit